MTSIQLSLHSQSTSHDYTTQCADHTTLYEASSIQPIFANRPCEQHTVSSHCTKEYCRGQWHVLSTVLAAVHWGYRVWTSCLEFCLPPSNPWWCHSSPSSLPSTLCQGRQPTPTYAHVWRSTAQIADSSASLYTTSLSRGSPKRVVYTQWRWDHLGEWTLPCTVA